MNLQHAFTLVRSALRSTRYLLDGSVHFPRARLGDCLELPNGETFIVYRETALERGVDDSPSRVVLVFGMRVEGRTAGETVRGVLFDPLANVATPFFAGMPGFRRKLWLAGTHPGEFLELYEWASREDADRFVAALEALIAPFDAAGDASFAVVDDDSIDDYVDARGVAWRDAARPRRRRRGPSRLRSLVVGLGVLVVGAYVYVSRRRQTDRDEFVATVDIEIDES